MPRWWPANWPAAGWTRSWAPVPRSWRELESEQEVAREQRVHWQVQEAQVAGGLRSAEERLGARGRDARGSRSRRDSAERRAYPVGDRHRRARRAAGRVAGDAGRAAGGPARAGGGQRRRGGWVGGRGGDPRRRRSARWRRPAQAVDAATEESHTLQVRLTEAAGLAAQHRRAGGGGVEATVRAADGGRFRCSTSIWRPWRPNRPASWPRWTRSAR